MEELLKIVQLVREEVPQARVKVDSLMVIHYFTIEELLNICNKYAKYYHEQQLKKSRSKSVRLIGKEGKTIALWSQTLNGSKVVLNSWY